MNLEESPLADGARAAIENGSQPGCLIKPWGRKRKASSGPCAARVANVNAGMQEGETFAPSKHPHGKRKHAANAAVVNA